MAAGVNLQPSTLSLTPLPRTLHNPQRVVSHWSNAEFPVSVKDGQDLYPREERHHAGMGTALVENMLDADTDLALVALQEALTRLLSVYVASLSGAAIFLVLGSHPHTSS